MIDSRGGIQLRYGQVYVGDEMEGAWFAPGNYVPQLYEKIEWGVKLPDQVEAAIDNWIHNDQNPSEPPLLPALNPFDPEQVDLKAVIDYTTVNNVFYSQPVYGFFYLPFLRNTTGDVNTWDWEEQPTDFRFRFRWSSTEEAHHSVHHPRCTHHGSLGNGAISLLFHVARPARQFCGCYPKRTLLQD